MRRRRRRAGGGGGGEDDAVVVWKPISGGLRERKRVKVQAKQSNGEESIKSVRQELLGDGMRVRLAFEWTRNTHFLCRISLQLVISSVFSGLVLVFWLRIVSLRRTLWKLPNVFLS